MTLKNSKDNVNKFFNDNKLLFSAYTIVFTIILIVYILLKIYPFGEFTLLKSDAFHAYIPVMNDIRDSIINNKNITYSWNGGLGVDLLNQAMSAFGSILNIIIFFFSSKSITEFFAVLVILKLPFSAVTFSIFAREKFKRNDNTIIAFAVMYALCAFVSALYWNIMWMDCVVYLPLVALGIERIVKQAKSLLYCISLSLAIFSHYGIAFFLCGFSVIYFVILIMLEKDNLQKKEINERIIIFITRSLLAGGMAAVSIIPIYYNLLGTNYLKGISTLPTEIKFYNSFAKFYTNHYFGMHPTVMVFSDVVPNVFSGALTLFILPFYFINKDIKLKEKILYSAFLLILFLGFNVNLFAYIYHGFHNPSMMPHRFSFIYSFLLIIMAYKAFINIKSIKQFQFISVFFLTAVVTVIMYKIYPQTQFLKPGKLSFTNLIINLILLVVYFTILYFFRHKNSIKLTRVVSSVLLAVVTLEIAGNTYIHFSHMNDGNRERVIMRYYEPMNEITTMLADEPAFYRAEFKHEYSMSDAKLYGYNGTNMFAGLPSGITALMDQIGVTSSVNSLVFANPTPLIHSIFGVKYQFIKNKPLPETQTLFKFEKQIGDIYLYKNPYVLPLGFIVNDQIMDLRLGTTSNPFDFQNDFVKKATDSDIDLFKSFSINTLESDLIELNATANPNKFDYEIDETVTPDMIPLITLTYIAPESKQTYIHVRSPGVTWADVWVGDKYVLSQNTRQPACNLDAGFVEKGSVIKIVLKANKKKHDDEEEFIRFGSIEFNAAQMDMESYEGYVSKLNNQPFNVTYYDNKSVKGNIDVKEEGTMFTSIPYDLNWQVKVDNKNVSVKAIGGGLIGVKLYPGTHTIEFTYHHRGVLQGIIISLTSISLLVFLTLKQTKKNAIGEVENEE